MLKPAIYILTVSLAAAAPSSQGQRSPAAKVESREILKKVMDVTGYEASISRLPESLEAYFKVEAPQGGKDPGGALLLKAYQGAFRKEKIVGAVYDHLERNFDAAKLEAVLKLHEEPLVKKLTVMEIESAQPEAVAPMQQFVTEATTKPLPEARMALIKAMDESCGVSELQVKIRDAMMWSLARAVRSTIPEGQKSSDAAFEGEFIAYLEGSAGEVRKSTQLLLAFSYRTATDDEIRTYTDRLKTEVGKWWLEATQRSLLYSLGRASDEAAESFARSLER